MRIAPTLSIVFVGSDCVFVTSWVYLVFFILYALMNRIKKCCAEVRKKFV